MTHSEREALKEKQLADFLARYPSGFSGERIVHHNWRGTKLVDVDDYITGSITHHDPYSLHSSEVAGHVAQRTAEALGRLVQVLATKGLLDKADVEAIAP